MIPAIPTDKEAMWDTIQYLGDIANYPLAYAKWYKKFNPFYLREELKFIRDLSRDFLERNSR